MRINRNITKDLLYFSPLSRLAKFFLLFLSIVFKSDNFFPRPSSFKCSFICMKSYLFRMNFVSQWVEFLPFFLLLFLLFIFMNCWIFLISKRYGLESENKNHSTLCKLFHSFIESSILRIKITDCCWTFFSLFFFLILNPPFVAPLNFE